MTCDMRREQDSEGVMYIIPQMILKPLLEHDGREYNRFYQLGIRDER